MYIIYIHIHTMVLEECIVSQWGRVNSVVDGSTSFASFVAGLNSVSELNEKHVVAIAGLRCHNFRKSSNFEPKP